MYVRYGFLTGNLFGNFATEEMQTVNEDASVARFANQMEVALKQGYPGADVEVTWQWAEGIKPQQLLTLVSQDGEEQRDEEESVERLASEIYDAQDWIVLR